MRLKQFKPVTLFLTLGLLFTLSGCNVGKQSMPAKHYLLTPDTQLSPLLNDHQEPPTVGVGRITIPGFIDRPQIITFKANNQVVQAEFDRWAENIGEGITRVLRENLAALLSPEKVLSKTWSKTAQRDYEVHTVINNFAADTKRNEVTLNVTWRISSSNDKVIFLVKQSTFTERLNGDSLDYSAIVDAMSSALSQYSKEVARALITLDEKTAK